MNSASFFVAGVLACLSTSPAQASPIIGSTLAGLPDRFATGLRKRFFHAEKKAAREVVRETLLSFGDLYGCVETQSENDMRSALSGNVTAMDLVRAGGCFKQGYAHAISAAIKCEHHAWLPGMIAQRWKGKLCEFLSSNPGVVVYRPREHFVKKGNMEKHSHLFTRNSTDRAQVRCMVNSFLGPVSVSVCSGWHSNQQENLTCSKLGNKLRKQNTVAMAPASFAILAVTKELAANYSLELKRTRRGETKLFAQCEPDCPYMRAKVNVAKGGEGLTYDKAAHICEKMGGRLARDNSVDKGRTHSSGCGFNRKFIWMEDDIQGKQHN